MTITSLRQARSSVRAIACALGRSPGTISRELARNVGSDGTYASLPAHALSRLRRIQARPAAKLHHDHVLWGTVLTMLDWKWSPQQIFGVLKRVWPDASDHARLARIDLHGHPRTSPR
jgi:IS30 family transposase